MKQYMFCMCIRASILLFVVIRIFVSILFTFVPRWFFTPIQFPVFWAKWYIYWRMSSLALPVLSNHAHCCIQSASLHPGAQKSQFRCSKKIDVEITKCLNTKEIQFYNHLFCRSSRSSNLLPKIRLQNDARQDFARRIWGVNNPEISHTRCWKWCQITNVILSARQSYLLSFGNMTDDTNHYAFGFENVVFAHALHLISKFP